MRTNLAGQKLCRIISIKFGNLPLFFVNVDSALQLAHPLTLIVRVLILVIFFASNSGSHMASTGFQASSDDFKIIDHATYCLPSQMKDMPIKQIQPSKSAKLIKETHQHRLKKIK
ncbi:uncharacterized protein [Bemisia tabaci]|uniref:uncharacterized protein n=1 Tax=Bemisia tabaci TaxID=7038 RepID=UPI003B286D49